MERGAKEMGIAGGREAGWPIGKGPDGGEEERAGEDGAGEELPGRVGGPKSFVGGPWNDSGGGWGGGGLRRRKMMAVGPKTAGRRRRGSAKGGGATLWRLQARCLQPPRVCEGNGLGWEWLARRPLSKRCTSRPSLAFLFSTFGLPSSVHPPPFSAAAFLGAGLLSCIPLP